MLGSAAVASQLIVAVPLPAVAVTPRSAGTGSTAATSKEYRS
jgi:hypothetical protein